MVERRVRVAEAPGSSPGTPTAFRGQIVKLLNC